MKTTIKNFVIYIVLLIVIGAFIIFLISDVCLHFYETADKYVANSLVLAFIILGFGLFGFSAWYLWQTVQFVTIFEFEAQLKNQLKSENNKVCRVSKDGQGVLDSEGGDRND